MLKRGEGQNLMFRILRRPLVKLLPALKTWVHYLLRDSNELSVWRWPWSRHCPWPWCFPCPRADETSVWNAQNLIAQICFLKPCSDFFLKPSQEKKRWGSLVHNSLSLGIRCDQLDSMAKLLIRKHTRKALYSRLFIIYQLWTHCLNMQRGSKQSLIVKFGRSAPNNAWHRWEPVNTVDLVNDFARNFPWWHKRNLALPEKKTRAKG